MKQRGTNRFSRVKPICQYLRINYLFFEEIFAKYPKTREKRFGAGKPVCAAFEGSSAIII